MVVTFQFPITTMAMEVIVVNISHLVLLWLFHLLVASDKDVDHLATNR